MAELRTSDESTPLMDPSPGGGQGPTSYYFLSRTDSQNKSASGTAEGGVVEGTGSAREEEVIETLPEGASGQDFESRPVASIRSDGTTSGRPSQKPGLFDRLLGRGRVAPSGANQEAILKHRQAAIKVEPKVFFANERTFLAWLHTSVLLAGASIAIMAFANSNPLSQLYGIILLPVAIAFISYAMIQYARRASMIRRRAPGPYEDIAGPTVLGIALMLSIIAQFSIKLYAVM
mmetsp:Transcript_11530/g.21941  ORF Transcript_11530/g.21941 Transcript_11530/m.21941 type:complete len:233 (-) Transcript_11530:530-1228(-)|eukprot:CAMPEP_0197437948 /NCGR_PEP_ID=MMETSP1175-20131217/5073_1 /TAXON_ID=1003142 /ORGANISM="Triceratium dubium, Strain CCMP147" /LENGTH=232 /DNA_ID=CAMNT_0042967591 /DNA_START=98 /DNA_END=796 /DNA_ORIENTATION=+